MTVAAVAFDARLTSERQRNVEGARAGIVLRELVRNMNLAEGHRARASETRRLE